MPGIPSFRPAEQLLLTKLKTECGYQFTSKLETMFGDIKLSRCGWMCVWWAGDAVGCVCGCVGVGR